MGIAGKTIPRWTPDEDAILRAGHADRRTHTAIARDLPGRSAQAIRARCEHLGLQTWIRPWTADDEATLRAMVAVGASIRDVAAALDRTRGAVRQRAMQMAVRFDKEATRRRLSEQRKQQWQQPELRAKFIAGMKAAITPERRAKSAALFWANDIHAKGVAAVKAEGPEARARRRKTLEKATQVRLERQMGWCPDAYRPLYREMMATQCGAAAARKHVEAKIAADRRAASEAEAAANGWSLQFQMELERVRAGAAIIERRAIGSKSYDYSLIGGALA